MSKLIVLCGLSGTGKTTWAREQDHAVHIEMDRLCIEMDGTSHRIFNRHSDPVFREMYNRVRTALLAGRDVIVDWPNMSIEDRRPWANLREERIAAYAKVAVFWCAEDECIRRAEERGRLVAETVAGIRWWASRWEEPSLREGFDSIEHMKVEKT